MRYGYTVRIKYWYSVSVRYGYTVRVRYGHAVRVRYGHTDTQCIPIITTASISRSAVSPAVSAQSMCTAVRRATVRSDQQVCTCD